MKKSKVSGTGANGPSTAASGALRGNSHQLASNINSIQHLGQNVNSSMTAIMNARMQ